MVASVHPHHDGNLNVTADAVVECADGKGAVGVMIEASDCSVGSYHDALVLSWYDKIFPFGKSQFDYKLRSRIFNTRFHILREHERSRVACENASLIAKLRIPKALS
jgi:hypothetical protein